MKKIILVLVFFISSLMFGTVQTMEFSGTSTTESGVQFTYATGSFVNSSDGTEMEVFDNHPYSHPMNGGKDYKDITISQIIYITTVNVTWAVNVQDFKLQFLNGTTVVKELSSLSTGDQTVNVLASKIRFLDAGLSSSGGFELATVSWDDAMPVELTSFTAKLEGNAVKLMWNTATEVNNYGFEIQRSCETENSGWQLLGFVNGYGNSNSTKKYSFLDEEQFVGEAKYRLKQIDNDGAFEYSDIIIFTIDIPNNFTLDQNFPNPFNPTTSINYQLPSDDNVEFTIHDILGNKVRTLISGKQSAGKKSVKWDGTNDIGSKVTSGIYFYRISTSKFVDSKKMTLMK